MWPKFLLWFVDPSHVHLCEVAARCSQTLFLLILHSQLCREEDSNLLQKRPPVWNTPFFRYSVARDISACRTLAGGKSLDFWTSHFSSSTWNCGQWSQLPLELLPSVWPQLEKAEVKPQCLVHFFNLGQLQCNTWQKLQQRVLRIHCALAFADTSDFQAESWQDYLRCPSKCQELWCFYMSHQLYNADI